MSDVVGALSVLLAVLVIATGVRLAAPAVGISYTVGLVLVGFGVSVVGLGLGPPLSPELISVIFLPTILFQGASEIEPGHFWDNLPAVLAITVLGLPVAILLLGGLASVAFGFPILVALLLSAIVYPVDPVSVIRVFRDVEAPARLAALVESESHLGDGFSIVVVATIVAALAGGRAGPLGGLTTAPGLVALGIDITVVSIGGLVVGVAAGGAVHLALARVDERMAELLLTIALPYGSYLIADRLLGTSGILATVAAGLVVGSYSKRAAIHPDNVGFMEEMWDTAAFLMSTYLFLVIGVQVPVARVLDNGPTVVAAIVLILLVRATLVYGLVGGLDRLLTLGVDRSYQHIMVLGGLHTVVPVALALSLPAGVPFRAELQSVVFGVAVLSIVLQGLLLPHVLGVIGTEVEPTAQ